MKWSTIATALCALPFALGGMIEVELVEREMGGAAVQVSGQTTVVTEIVILWVNNGGGAATTTMAPPVSVAKAAAPAATHTVAVGGPAGLVFVPETISAALGDSVVFVFYSQNHTVTQSAFAKPCVKLAGGMDSGFMANVNNTVVPPPMMAMQVTVATPIWFYCKQGNHCGKGMTFSINPTAQKSQADFKQMAIAQNGTGTVANIVGGTTAVSAVTLPAAAATPPAAAGTTVAAVAGTTMSTVVAAVATQSAVANANNGAMAVGSGSSTGGVCSCSCFCGVSSFPLAAQGLGASGGLSGSLPMAAMMA